MDINYEPALCLQPVQQYHRIPCPAGRRKHPCAEGQLRCVAQPGSLIRRQTVWHILRSAATLTASATPTKMNTERAATNGKVFLQKRRQRTERSRSNMNWHYFLSRTKTSLSLSNLYFCSLLGYLFLSTSLINISRGLFQICPSYSYM